MIDHVGISVADYDSAKEFYENLLSILGAKLFMEVAPPDHTSRACGFATLQGSFWIADEGKTTPHTHIAFTAPNRAAVDTFYHKAIELGATDNGAPGLRPEYHEHYYGAFVLDADGHNLEAVCHQPA